MKLIATYLSSALLLGSWAAAQTDPLLRSTPVQVRPAASGFSSRSEPLAQARGAVFGNPRISSAGGVTKLVFDLPAGMTYTLVPTFGGLRLDVGGARVVPASALRLAENLNEYRAGTGQIVMGTPFPLSLSDGWRATEATVASGGRVLIVELGAQMRGGAVSSVSGRVLAAAPADARAQASLQAPVPATDNAATSEHANDLPPGDIVQRAGTLPPAPAALTDTDTARPSTLVGRVPGTLQAGASVSTPRVGKSPGVTRLVLDLPPGTGYRIVPNTLGLRVELVGVSLGSARTSEQDTSSEVRAWRYERTGEGVNLTIVTGAPTTSRSGWRSQVLPPSSGNLTRLVLDISPAMANLTPLTSKDRLIGSVPPMRVSTAPSGLALLSSASYARPRVVIDPGHGGKDPGAMGTIVEKQVTLDVAKRVRDLLVAAGVDAVLTRETDRELHADKSTDLIMRAQMGTPGTQMFVSIHVNATEASTALKGYGVETWWNPNHARSYDLASTLQRDLVKTTGAFDRGIKGYRSLSVLRNSKIPAALVEIGFTSHPIDGLNLTDNNYLERVAVGIASGVRDALLTGVSASGQPAAAASTTAP